MQYRSTTSWANPPLMQPTWKTSQPLSQEPAPLPEPFRILLLAINNSAAVWPLLDCGRRREATTAMGLDRRYPVRNGAANSKIES
jgi:hypothetical protein